MSEYWIADGIVLGAGDEGDTNHIGHVISAILSQHDLDDNFDVDSVDDDWLRKKGLNEKEIHVLRFTEYRGNNNYDPRDYAMQEWGWIRVAGNNVQVWTLDNNVLKEIADGLYEIYGEDGDDVENSNSMRFNIEVSSSNKYFERVPFRVIAQENVALLREYMLKYAGSYLINWYKNYKRSLSLGVKRLSRINDDANDDEEVCDADEFLAGENPNEISWSREKSIAPINWDEGDLYGVWNENSVRRFLDLPEDSVIYKSIIDLSDLNEHLVEEETPEDDLSYDWSELQINRSSPPPIIVTRVDRNTFKIEDGNHRVRFFRERGYTKVAAWVYDAFITNINRAKGIERYRIIQ